MATQTVFLTGPTGLTSPTLKLFPDGSDAAVAGAPFTLTEATNRKGYYGTTFSGTLAGLHMALLSDSVGPVATGWVTLTNATGSYGVTGERPPVLAAGSISDATFAVPADLAGVPAGPIGWLRRVYQRGYNRRTRNRNTGVVTVFAADDATPVATYTQSTAGNVDIATKAT